MIGPHISIDLDDDGTVSATDACQGFVVALDSVTAP